MAIDPMTQDDQAVLDRQDEDRREQRWNDFEREIRWFYGVIPKSCHRWAAVVDAVGFAMENSADPDCMGDFPRACLEFSKTEGWSGVFAALARALREGEQGQ